MDANKRIATNSNLVYPDLSYQVMGILFKIHNRLGPNYQERYYQRAVKIELDRERVPYEKEKPVPLRYEGENIGRYFIDFLIDNKIALEIKADDYFRKKYLHQVLDYLAATNTKLAILVNFRKDKLFYKRIINPKVHLVDDKSHIR
jgi:GxxExxY protein